MNLGAKVADDGVLCRFEGERTCEGTCPSETLGEKDWALPCDGACIDVGEPYWPDFGLVEEENLEFIDISGIGEVCLLNG